ncbi:MAG: efflux RND transporter periplasmic adaptor subunit [Gallionella sp.]|jgi:Cu(I)/Ag(I) efflux system membrane fusion protein
MKIINISMLFAALLAGGAGYWLGGQREQGTGVQETSPVARKLLYYRNPMGLPDTSPIPKKDSMGMDYVPVYQGDDEDSRVVALSFEQVQKLGVTSEAAQRRVLNRTLRVAGRIELDERRIYTIAPKFAGWVEKLYVNSTGQTVHRGEPLFDVYSPELLSTQREYALAKQGETALEYAGAEARAGMKQLAEASLSRLKNWDVTVSDRRNQTLSAPVSGIVVEKKAVQGMRFEAGEALYLIADLSTLWVIAEVAVQDIALVSPGMSVEVSSEAYPERTFTGRVDFVYPILNAATRTVQVRVELNNPQGLLKPAMFASVLLNTVQGSAVLTVPVTAVIDSGTSQVVLVRLAEGRFEPRVIKPGVRNDEYLEVLAGLAEGEQVVTSANFLIDAESNLKAALAGMKPASTPSAQPAKVPTAQPAKVQPDAHDKHTAHQSAATVVGHQATGVFNALNADGTVNITHGPVASLNWPGMTMDFALANVSLVAAVKPGSKISFEIVERAPDEWVITRVSLQP